MTAKKYLRALAAAVAAALLIAAPSSLAAGGENSAPLAENMAFETYRGIPISGTLRAVDPNGDAVVFKLVDKPVRGTVEISADGAFTYTPFVGKKGTDTFTYAAVDEHNAVSAPATVTVTIKKQSTKTVYSDMDGNEAHYAALRLAEKGLLTGEKLGGTYLFRPEETITRGEFLAMCIELAGMETIGDISRTGFYDDTDIPSWEKPYVAAGLIAGIVEGYRTEDGRAVFRAGQPITRAEAMVALDNAIGVTDVSSFSEYEAVCPAWACQSAANLDACSIVPSLFTGYENELTRAEAAMLLSGAMDILEARG